MSKIDQLIAVFKEVKEDLNKNVNNSYGGAPNATTGTSGGQGGMYRSEAVEKQMVSASPGGAQDMHMIKASKNGQWHMDKADEGGPKDIPVGSTGFPVRAGKLPKSIKKPSRPEKTGVKEYDKAVHGPQGKTPVRSKLGPQSLHAEIDPADHPKRIAKSDELADNIIEKLEKACGMKKEDDNYISQDGKNREANPKLRESDLGPGGKVHLIKEEGINEEGGNKNKEKFKVMPMAPEKSVKHLDATGAPYNGKDKDVKKGECTGKQDCMCFQCRQNRLAPAKKSEDMEKDAADPKLAPKDKKVKALQQKIDAGTYKPDPKKIANAMLKKEKIGHIQGNESEGNDENKAPGRGTLSV